MIAIHAENLVRVYESKGMLGKKQTVTAVDGVCLQVQQGELYGLLGPNGAGKTTMIRMLTTLLLPTGGRASIMGHDVVREADRVRRMVGVVYGGDKGLYGRVSGRDNLKYFANLYGLDRQVCRRRIDELLGLVGLADRADHKVEGYSRGMKQRLHIARALLHDPQVLFLDEPTIGIDPVGARQLRQLVLDLKKQGKTILLTTHYMMEADVLADRVGIIKAGKIAVEDSPQGLRRFVRDLTVLELEVADAPPDFAEVLKSLAGVRTVTVESREHSQIISLQSPLGEGILPAAQAQLKQGRILRSMVRPPTLEDAYVSILQGTGRLDGAAREATA